MTDKLTKLRSAILACELILDDIRDEIHENLIDLAAARACHGQCMICGLNCADHQRTLLDNLNRIAAYNRAIILLQKKQGEENDRLNRLSRERYNRCLAIQGAYINKLSFDILSNKKDYGINMELARDTMEKVFRYDIAIGAIANNVRVQG